jgi:hypothetical protein
VEPDNVARVKKLIDRVEAGKLTLPMVEKYFLEHYRVIVQLEDK